MGYFGGKSRLEIDKKFMCSIEVIAIRGIESFGNNVKKLSELQLLRPSDIELSY